MRRFELDNHVRFDCLENEITCNLCNTEGIKRKEINVHKEMDCLENLIQCK
jgi:hypothetical protein